MAKKVQKAINIAKINKITLMTGVFKENKIALNFLLKNDFKIKKYDKK